MTRAVVLVNLGTPTDPTVSAVRRFLRDFLSDRRVVELPRLLWWPILYGFILPFRPHRAAVAYRQLWQQWGDSPLRLISQRQQRALQKSLQQPAQPHGSRSIRVELAMTYGGPELGDVLADLQRDGIRHVLLLPLYPQYSATTTAAVVDRLMAFTRSQRDFPSLALVKDYHDHPLYIAALAESVQTHWRQHGRGARLLLSFHGIPKRNVDLGDPYLRQCMQTAERLAARLQLTPEQWSVSFQSRLGRAEWLQPYTSDLLRQWGAEGLGSVDIICPAFSADCLETLEEIDIENRQFFEGAGGGEYRYIPCLNDSPAHIDLLHNLVMQYLPGDEIDTRHLELIR